GARFQAEIAPRLAAFFQRNTPLNPTQKHTAPSASAKPIGASRLDRRRQLVQGRAPAVQPRPRRVGHAGRGQVRG
ncbi:hypothetical protein, partial [Methylobacterium nigriterrae]|uniref:hypothetical protein n=1 Tax=Methylobacterium nigriterrae TaxID=3127512 RepID=UPI00301419C6